MRDAKFPDTLKVDETVLPLEVVRKRVKNLNARLRDGRLLVSAPLRASHRWVRDALPELARSLLKREHQRDLSRDGRALAIARRVAKRFPRRVTVTSVTFTTRQHSCWGTYSPTTRSIRLSAALRHMPPKVLEAVVAHELCHTVYLRHGPRFQALLRRVFPEADYVEGFLDGAVWLAENGKAIPPLERGPLVNLGKNLPEPVVTPKASDAPTVEPKCFRRGLLFDL
ncbi:MAG: SprT-like domain-containing protein [Planctomycetota bacterium]|jgi:predicted metal-dependent hydrolase